MTTVLFVLFPGVTQLDMTGPAQVLSRLPGATMLIAAASLDPIMTDSGFALVPTTTFADAPPADIICVPGGHGVADALGDAATINFVARQAATAKWVTSVCTGAFLLGRVGLLTGKRATTTGLMLTCCRWSARCTRTRGWWKTATRSPRAGSPQGSTSR